MKIRGVKVGTYRELRKTGFWVKGTDGLPPAQTLGVNAAWYAMNTEQKKSVMLSEPKENGHITLDKIVRLDNGNVGREPAVSIAIDGTIKPITWVTPKSWRK